MNLNLTEQMTSRSFKLWEYQASHGQLLIRSPKSPATRSSPEYCTNVDIVCLGVEYMSVPTIFRGLTIASPSSAEIDSLSVLVGKLIRADDIAILVSNSSRYAIIASLFSLSENDWDIFDSPFEFRSRYRSQRD